MKTHMNESDNQTEQPQVDINYPDYDQELARKIVENVPRYTWPAVLDACVVNILDELPFETLSAMAEMYLIDYYIEHPNQIIPDMLRIKGAETTVHVLDSLQLEKLPGPARKRAEEEEESKANQNQDAVSETDPA